MVAAGRPAEISLRTPALANGDPASRHRSVAVLGAMLVGLGLSAAAVVAAPTLMPSSYSWISHTTSESAAQGIGGAWLARLGFLLFGLSVTALAFAAVSRWGRWSAVLHYAFGALMTAAAAFSTRPWTGATFDQAEDLLHSIAATAMGFAFAAGVVAAVIHRGRLVLGARILIDMAAVGASVVIPLAMSAAPGAAGVAQRIMFTVAYVWYAVTAIGLIGEHRHSAMR